MRLDEISQSLKTVDQTSRSSLAHAKTDPLTEGPSTLRIKKVKESVAPDVAAFDDMAHDLDQMGKPKPVPTGGRWHNGNRAEKEKESKFNAKRGTATTAGGTTFHKAGNNYSGKGYNPLHDTESRGNKKDPILSLPLAGKFGGSSATRKFREATGDNSFDKMMGDITGSDTPRAMPAQGTGQVDRRIMELTHKIFLRLREYDDPEIYQKFIDFMTKTIATNVGPLDESRRK